MDPGWSLPGWRGLNQRTWYFAGILSVPPSFSINPAKNGRKGGQRTICTIGSWEVARIRRQFLSRQFVYFYWDTNELLISCVWRSGWCEQDVFASTWQSDWEWVSDQIVIRPRLGYIWVNTHSSPPQHCWHCEIWFRDSYVTRTSLNFWTLNWKLGQRLNIWREIIRKL